jgi:BMFP domain-containing protein YqiC
LLGTNRHSRGARIAGPARKLGDNEAARARSAIRLTRSAAQLARLESQPVACSAPGATIEGSAMLNSERLDELTKKISQAINESPAKDIERNVKAMLQSGLQRLNLVPRDEFDVQAEVLARTRAKLEALEARVAELEAAAQAPRRKAPKV